MLAYPPKMYQEIMTWIKSIYATWAASKARADIKHYKNMINLIKKDKEQDPQRQRERLRDREEDLQKLTEVLSAAKADGAKGRSKTDWKRVFETNLTGLPPNYPAPELSAGYPVIPVTVTFTGKAVPMKEAVRGTWNRSKGLLRIILHGRPPDNVFNYRFGIKQMGETLKHELRHMMQSMFEAFQAELLTKKLIDRGVKFDQLSPKEQQRILDSIRGGQPTGEVSLKDIPQKDQYYLDPLEFFTWLGQSEWGFLNELRTNREELLKHVEGGEPEWDPKPTREEFDRFVGNPKPVKAKSFARKLGDPINTHPFFEALWTHDKKRWRRAVAELWKRVHNRLVPR